MDRPRGHTPPFRDRTNWGRVRLVTALASAAAAVVILVAPSRRQVAPRPGARPPVSRVLRAGNDRAVRKTVFSSKQRLVFVAGLEGTGHHYFFEAFALCAEHGICEANDSTCRLAKNFYPRINSAPTLKEYEKMVRKGRNHLGRFALREKDMPAGEEEGQAVIVPLNCVKACGGLGMMSFPSGELHTSTNHVNLRLMAALVDAAGLDLRIIYLMRDAESILHSTVTNRGFGTYMKQGRTLLDNALTMRNQLDLIDPSFVTCFGFASVGDPREIQQLAQFIAPGGGVVPQVAAHFTDATGPGHRRTKTDGKVEQRAADPLYNPEPAADMYGFARELQIVLDGIDADRCGAGPR